jgi:hypothetical protein
MRNRNLTSGAARGRTSLTSLLALAALGGSLAVPTSASAATTPPVLERPAAAVTADALPTAQVDGIVWKQTVAGNTVFAGGLFASARPAGAKKGAPSTVVRSNLMAYDIRTGVMKPFAPRLNGEVRALATSPDKKTLYVGGNFTKVGRTSRPYFAAFDVATGKLLKYTFKFNARVKAIATMNTTVYVGGSFTAVGTSPRQRGAAFGLKSNKLTRWNPRADRPIEALVTTPDKTRVIVGGSFATLSGKPNPGMGAVTAAWGTLRTWKINRAVKSYGSAAAVLDLVADRDTIYGATYGFATGNFEGVFAASPVDGSVKWLQDCHGDQYGLAPVGNLIYSVGHAHHCSNIGGFGEIPPQRVLVVTKAVRGTVAPNTQKGPSYGEWGGYPAPALHNWFPKLNAGTVSGAGQGAWSIAATSRYVVLGGEFTTVNGKPQQGLTRFTTPAGNAPRKMGPQVTGRAAAPVVTRAGTGRLRVAWKANYDLDNQSLRYDILRNGQRIGTVRHTSRFYDRPEVAWIDVAAKPGVRYSYSLRVSDADGNRVTSASTSATG